MIILNTILFTLLFENAAAKLLFCPAAVACANETLNELEKWECFGRCLFSSDQKLSIHSKYVQHDCNGVGWGNSIRGLISSASVAAVLGRRLIMFYPVFNRMFLPPNNKLSTWDLSLSMEVSGRFDYEKYGRNFANWTKNISIGVKSSDVTYENKKVISGGICAGISAFVTEGNCVSKALPLYGKCVKNMLQNVAGIPFFYLLFTRPSPLMVESITLIRNRLSLPLLAKGLEPSPGAWALRTPGYYILALHYRNVPIGFEPSAFEVQKHYQGRMKAYRSGLFQGYWVVAERAAQKALQLAKCRGQKLLIYFASDDALKLRQVVEQKLSAYGRVIFGLKIEEVGHMVPNNWSQKDLDRLEDMKRSSKVDGEIVHVEKSAKALEVHGNMAMAEWWILANSNWLLSHSGTSFSETAATFGLGPRGVMERFDFLTYEESFETQFRIDWTSGSCDNYGAADSKHAISCPNTKDLL